MKPSLAKVALISSCALMATHASAQSAALPSTAAASTAAEAATTPAPKTLAAAANAKAAAPASTTKVIAAGSVIIMLADGIVANARVAQIQSPAPGFVYER